MIEEIPEEINVHRRIYGKDSIEVDYDSIGQCPFCNSRIDEFNFCACGGNLGISQTGHILEAREDLERYGWWINELESLGRIEKTNEFKDLNEMRSLTQIINRPFILGTRLQLHYFVEDRSYSAVVIKDQQRFWKRKLIVDDDIDVTMTFRAVIEESNNDVDVNKRIEVYTSNDPVASLSEFKPNFYDLLLVDINMQRMNGFELSEMILAIDINVLSWFLCCYILKLKGLTA